MAGQQELLSRIIDGPAGPAADLVPDFAKAFKAVSEQDWSAAVPFLTRAMSDLARIGGSRAQRDMVEETLLLALTKLGKHDEARDIAALRRPILVPINA